MSTETFQGQPQPCSCPDSALHIGMGGGPQSPYGIPTVILSGLVFLPRMWESPHSCVIGWQPFYPNQCLLLLQCGVLEVSGGLCQRPLQADSLDPLPRLLKSISTFRKDCANFCSPPTPFIPLVIYQRLAQLHCEGRMLKTGQQAPSWDSHCQCQQTGHGQQRS